MGRSSCRTRLDAQFWDETAGGWFATSGEDPSVLLRLKEDYDGAEPSASSMAVMNLLVLTHLAPDGERQRRVEQALARFGPGIGDAARMVPLVAAALSARHAGIGQVVIAEGDDGEGARALASELGSHYLPFAVTIRLSPAAGARLAERLPLVAPLTPVDGRAAAYVCRDFTCLRPVTTRSDLCDALARGPALG